MDENKKKFFLGGFFGKRIIENTLEKTKTLKTKNIFMNDKDHDKIISQLKCNEYLLNGVIHLLDANYFYLQKIISENKIELSSEEKKILKSIESNANKLIDQAEKIKREK